MVTVEHDAQSFEAFMREAGIDVEPADYESTTLTNAGIDSLLVLQWAVLLEERSGRALDDDLLDSLSTVGDLKHFYDRLEVE